MRANKRPLREKFHSINIHEAESIANYFQRLSIGLILSLLFGIYEVVQLWRWEACCHLERICWYSYVLPDHHNLWSKRFSYLPRLLGENLDSKERHGWRTIKDSPPSSSALYTHGRSKVPKNFPPHDKHKVPFRNSSTVSTSMMIYSSPPVCHFHGKKRHKSADGYAKHRLSRAFSQPWLTMMDKSDHIFISLITSLVWILFRIMNLLPTRGQLFIFVKIEYYLQLYQLLLHLV